MVCQQKFSFSIRFLSCISVLFLCLAGFQGEINCQNCEFLTEQYDQYVQYGNPYVMDIGNGDTVTESEILVPESVDFVISDIELRLEIEHESLEDLVVSIISPSGTEIVLHNKTQNLTNPGSINENFTKEELLDFIGEKCLGSWILNIIDDVPSNTGELKFLSLK